MDTSRITKFELGLQIEALRAENAALRECINKSRMQLASSAALADATRLVREVCDEHHTTS